MCIYIYCESDNPFDLSLLIRWGVSVVSGWQLYGSMLRHSSMLFTRTCSMGSWAKGSTLCGTLGWKLHDFVHRDNRLVCGRIPIRTPHAWLILSVTRRRVVSNFLHCSWRLLNSGEWVENLLSGLLHLHLSALRNLNYRLHMTLKSTWCGVAGKRFHPSMMSATKKIEQQS